MIERRVLHREIAIVIGLSLGASAIWSVLRIIARPTREVPLSAQTLSLIHI